MAAPGVLGSDYDPDGDAFILYSAVNLTHGTFTSLVTNGQFTWVPPPNFRGAASFTYRVREQSTQVFGEGGDVTIFVGVEPAAFVFNDSFEAGDTATWSLVVP